MPSFVQILCGLGGVALGVELGIDIVKVVMRFLRIFITLSGIGLAILSRDALGALRTQANAETVDFFTRHWIGIILLCGGCGLVVSLTFFPLMAVRNLTDRVHELENKFKQKTA